MASKDPECKIELSSRVTTLPPSPTLTVLFTSFDRKAKGLKTYDFGIGELTPTHKIPKSFVEPFIDAIRSEKTQYCREIGIESIRKAISNDLNVNFNLSFDEDQIVVTPGPRDAVYKTLMAILDPSKKRNRAVAFLPSYEIFAQQPFLLTGERTIFSPVDEDFLPDLEKFKALLEEKGDEIAVLFINSPNNPTGVTYPKRIIKGITDIVKEYPEIAIVSDEVYRTIIYDDAEYSSPAHFLPQQTIILGGISKEIAGTGIRLGFAAAPKAIAKYIGKATGMVSTCISMASQIAYASFLNNEKEMEHRKKIASQLKVKRDLLLKLFSTLPGLKDLKVPAPTGAFYIFPCVKSLYGCIDPASKKPIENDIDFCLFVLNTAGLVLTPGTAFDVPGHFRLSYGLASADIIEEACKELSTFVTVLQESKK
mmetsp:Transcript_13173/g.14599  ORF Transcript_13173/g.14599 Transcript_13173/m.14599 type:complete len:424 (-) Transcript_13173:57-1328(-)